ncbi:MAG: tRNA (cytidine(34)-2'-O)-methyltransferase [Pseudomonadota bacterium]
MPEIALFEPDIPQNVGAIIRLSTCLNVKLHIIEPTSFILNNKKIRRAGMDYIQNSEYITHKSWNHFVEYLDNRKREINIRLLVFTTKATESFMNYNYQDNDILLFGRESSGVTEYVREYATKLLKIPISKQTRSLNVASSVAMALTESLRQTNKFVNITNE